MPTIAGMYSDEKGPKRLKVDLRLGTKRYLGEYPKSTNASTKWVGKQRASNEGV